MADYIDLDDIAMRPSRHWCEDGLVEIFLGLIMLVPSVLFSLASKLPKGSPLGMVVPLVWLGTILLMKRGFEEMKKRVIFPRSGYLALPEPGKAMRVGI